MSSVAILTLSALYTKVDTFADFVDPDEFDWLCWGLMTRQPLWVILCCLTKKGRKEIEEIVEEMKEGQGRKRTGMKVKKQKK